MKRPTVDALARPLAVGVASLAAATAVVAVLESTTSIPNASAVYLVAVVATAFVGGTWGAIAAAIASFLLYDFFFTEPVYTFTIRDPAEWLSVIVLLFVGIVVGQLAALQRARTEEARAREHEAYALFQLSRALATRDSTMAVLPIVATILGREAGMEQVWFALGEDGREHIVPVTAEGVAPSSPAVQAVLQRMPGDEPARWVRVHQPRPGRGGRGGPDIAAFRVRIEAGSAYLGSLWGLRQRVAGDPGRTETRLLTAAADQLGGVLTHDRLAGEAQQAEIARQSDALKSALVQSVSHDLRTPLATIRAAAGTLRPDAGASVEDVVESVDAIDREVQYLDRMVTNLLDLSRIEAGSLLADRDVFELDDLVGRTLDRLGPRLAPRPVSLELAAPPVVVDPVFLDEVVANVLENAIKYTPRDAAVRISATALSGQPFVRLTIEDGGPGVPDEHLPHLFEKFFRVPGGARRSRSGTGIGLAVVLGLTEAMDGRVAARRSALGGLAVDLDLPLAVMNPEAPE